MPKPACMVVTCIIAVKDVLKAFIVQPGENFSCMLRFGRTPDF